MEEKTNSNRSADPYWPRLQNQIIGFEFLQHLWRNLLVHIDDLKGHGTVSVRTERHAGDVDSIAGQDRSHQPDYAWKILVTDQE
jgi:hypothetical protein